MNATIISIFVNCLHRCASSRYLQRHNLRYVADQSRCTTKAWKPVLPGQCVYLSYSFLFLFTKSLDRALHGGSRSPLTSMATCQATYSDKKRLLQERVFERRQNKVALVDRPIEAGIMQVHRRISRGEPLKTRASTACGSRYFMLVAFHAGPVPGYCLTVSRENARREIASVKRATRRFHICVPSAISFSPFALSFSLSFLLPVLVFLVLFRLSCFDVPVGFCLVIVTASKRMANVARIGKSGGRWSCCSLN